MLRSGFSIYFIVLNLCHMNALSFSDSNFFVLHVGEVMQLDTYSDKREILFEQYLQKTFKKTASLMAYSCQSVIEYHICAPSYHSVHHNAYRLHC